MDDRERLRREDPSRTEPIRKMSGLFRSDTWQQEDVPGNGHRNGNASPSNGGPAAEGVNAAYQVYDEWVGEGHRTAQRNNFRPYDYAYTAGPGAASQQEAAARMAASYYEAVPLWTNLISSMASAVCGGLYPHHGYPHHRYPHHGYPHHGYPPPESPPPYTEYPPEPERPHRVRAVVIAAAGKVVSRPILKMQKYSDALKVRDLSTDPPPGHVLTPEPLETDGDGRILIKIVVNAAVIDGTYSGLIVDSKTGEALGTLTVKVGA